MIRALSVLGAAWLSLAQAWGQAQLPNTNPYIPGGPGTAFTYGALYSSGGAPTAAGTTYAPGDTITLTGGAATRNVVLAVTDTQVVSATVAAGGTTCTNGASQTVTGTTGTGTKFSALVTVAGNAITAVNSISVAGDYTVNPTTPTAEPVTGDACTGSQLNVVLGVLVYQVVNVGAYSVVPTNPVAQGSTTGSGTGATFTLSWGPYASWVDTQSLPNGNGNLFIGGNHNSGSNANEVPGTVNYGYENTFIGVRAGGLATSGSFNTAIGHNAYGIGAGVNLTGGTNTFVGNDSGRNVGATATNNTAIGKDSGRVVTGNNNTFLGASTGLLVAGGATNTIIGQSVGSTVLTTGNHNVLIGVDNTVTTPANNTTNFINIGNAIYAGYNTGGTASLTLAAGEVGLGKITASGSAPGAAGGKFELVCGTNAGSAKLIAYAGTSTTPVTITDNIGSGVTGC